MQKLTDFPTNNCLFDKRYKIQNFCMLLEDRLSHLSQMHYQTSRIQQIEQCMSNTICQQFPQQIIAEKVHAIAKEIYKLVHNILKWKKQNQTIKYISNILYTKQNPIQQQQQANKSGNLSKYQGRIQNQIKRNCTIVQKMIKYAQGCNLKTVTMEYLDKYIKLIINENNNIQGSKKLQKFLCFLKNYQSESVYKKFEFFISLLQTQIHKQLSKTMRQILQDQQQFQQNISHNISHNISSFSSYSSCSSSNDQYLTKMNSYQLSKIKMQKRIDLEIIENQIEESLKRIVGSQRFCCCCEEERNSKYAFIDKVYQQRVKQSNNNIVCWISIVQIILQSHNKDQNYGNKSSVLHQSTDSIQYCEQLLPLQNNPNTQQNSLLSTLNKLLSVHLNKIQSQYQQQFQVNNIERSRTQLKNLLLDSLKNILADICSRFIELQNTRERISKIQNAINYLGEEIVRMYQNKSYEESEKENQMEVIVPLSNFRDRCSSRRNCSNQQLSVKIKYRRKAMAFRVRKTMHIVDQYYFQHQQRNNKQNYSRSKSSSSSKFLQSRNTSPKKYKQRIVTFGKKKILLKKQNPHFHEEIQLKRIQKIKIVSQKCVNIYFKKGYMTLQFIQVGQSAKQWLKCFKAVYCEELILNKIIFLQRQHQTSIEQTNPIGSIKNNLKYLNQKYSQNNKILQKTQITVSKNIKQ